MFVRVAGGNRRLILEASRVVSEELERGLPQWQSLPEELRPALLQHCDKLIGLVTSLTAAGRDQEDIRVLVSKLLTSYGIDLVAALEARK